ncbi:MAG: aminotransferase class V-fold PLP-dependent enzyme [Acidobacteria bacterium]|nr:aminotransferase class V-fold PLP-dependent enzyme [Acidobacteriota bacterium]
MSERAARIYLDHNATSPLRPAARRAMERVFGLDHANPSSMHQEGREARSLIEQARRQVANLAGCRPSELVFTSGGSEAIAAAVRGVCDRAPDDRRRIVVSGCEHSAVLESARLAARRGGLVVPVSCGADGRVDVDRFLMHLGPDVALACLQWANNETGVVQPVEEIGRACRERGVPFLVDAVQAAGKLEISLQRSSADLVAISAHKIGGPQGAGALIVRSGLVLAPLIGGGAQEKRRRGGTENVAGLVGFGAAADEALAEIRESSRRLLRQRARIESRLREMYPTVRFHGQGVSRLPNTVNFAIPGVPGEMLTIALDLAGIAVSTGSACASGAVEPSHVLLDMGFDDDEARGAVRISLGWSSTPEEVDLFFERFPEVVEQVREGLRQSAS